MSMGNVRGGQISAGDKKKIADLKKKAKRTAVYRGGKRLNQSELDQRKADLQRQIANIQTRGGSEAYSYRPRFFGTPKKDVRTPSVTDTNINDLIVSNLGQQGGLPTPRVPRTGYEPRLSESSKAQPGASRIPSIFSQYVPGGDVVYKQGFAQRSNELSPSLMDTLRANTGAFTDNIRLPGGLEIRYGAPRSNAPSVTPNPYVSGQQTFTPPDTKFGFDFSLPTETPMTTDGRSFTRPYGTQRGISLGTVGGFGRGLFDELASSGAGYFPQTEPSFDIPVGAFEKNRTIPFGEYAGMKMNDVLRSGLEAASRKFPNLTAYISDKVPFSTGFADPNITAMPRGRQYDIYGNPRTILPNEIQRTYGQVIEDALKGKKYTLL